MTRPPAAPALPSVTGRPSAAGSPLLQLRRSLARSPRLTLHLDFDGTLLPLAADPSSCRPDAALQLLLARLVQHPRLAVAILSGRSLADLESRLAIAGLDLAGNHGLEIAVAGRRWRHPGAVHLIPLLQSLSEHACGQLAGIPGVQVENKTLSLSLHSRRVPPAWRGVLQRRLQAFRTELAAWPELMVRQGREVLELRPALGWTKASASRRIRAERDARPAEPLFYAGDDDSDEDVFRAFPAAISVRIGAQGDSGAPPTAARFQLPDSRALVQLLAQLLQELRD